MFGLGEKGFIMEDMVRKRQWLVLEEGIRLGMRKVWSA